MFPRGNVVREGNEQLVFCFMNFRELVVLAQCGVKYGMYFSIRRRANPCSRGLPHQSGGLEEAAVTSTALTLGTMVGAQSESRDMG